MVGFSKAFLSRLEGLVPPGSVVVLEEPDIIAKRGLAAVASELRCVAELVSVRYHQSDGFEGPGAAAAARHRVAAIVPGLEYAVQAAATLAELLGLPGATPSAAATLRDKLRLRAVTSRAGVLNPEWQEVSCPDDVRAFAAGGPVVIKPADRQASLGVHLLDDPTLLHSAWNDMVNAQEATQVPDRPLRRRYLAERRLLGPEFSVEALVQDGRVVFDNVTGKTLLPGRYPVEVQHVVPAPVPEPVAAGLTAALRSLVAAVGFRTGVLHSEWIQTDLGPALVECAGRPPGDGIVDLVDLAYGTQMFPSVLELLAGREPDLPRRPRGAAAIRFLTAGPGEVAGVSGVDVARKLPGVREVAVGVTPGQLLGECRSSWDRCGHVVVTAGTATGAADLAEQVAATIRIETRGSSAA